MASLDGRGMGMNIVNRHTGSIIFSADAESMGKLVEMAVLSGANLFRANLSGANLFRANLSGANLFEANLSEAYLYEAVLINAVGYCK